MEINGTIGVPSDLDGISYHAQLISTKRLTMKNSDLNIRVMESEESSG
jgi:hypothetical protein